MASPVDWGTPEIVGPDRATRCLKHIDALLRLHTPDVLVLQDTVKTGTRRAPRIQNLNLRTLELAKRRGISVRTYSRAQIRRIFRGLRSHDEAEHGRDDRRAHSCSQPVCPAAAQTLEERGRTNGHIRSRRFGMEVSANERQRCTVLSQYVARAKNSYPAVRVIQSSDSRSPEGRHSQ